ncbi:MAG: AfsR/SARP family transcriptional regulator, partial [Actinomycetota bacterium]
MEFRILGPLEVVRDGQAIDLGGAKQRRVLASLLINARRVVSAERLVDDVWESSAPPAAAATLRSYLSNIRKALQPEKVLHTREGGYVLDVPDRCIDAMHFEDLVTRARTTSEVGDAALAERELIEALALWRGGALQDFAYAAFAQVEVSRLEDQRLGAVEDLMEIRLTLGRHAEIAAELEALTAKHPLRERLWSARMVSLYRSGRSGEAIEAYEQVRTHLSETFGIDPS